MSSVENYRSSRWQASLFFIVRIEPNTHRLRRFLHNWLYGETCANYDCLSLSCTLEVNGVLRARSRMVHHSKTSDVKLLQTYVSFSCRCDSMLRLVCSSTYDTMLLLVQVHRNTNDRPWIASRIRSLCCVLETCLLVVFFFWYSMLLNIDMNMTLFEITRFRRLEECSNVSHDLDRCVAWKYVSIEFVLVCPWYRVCLWKSLGATLQRALSPMLRKHAHLFSIDFLLATPIEINYSRILFANSATVRFHRIIRQRVRGLEVWLSQFEWSSVVLWVWWVTRNLLNFSSSSLM